MPAASPRSFVVTTAEAVAVGQMKQSMAASMMTRPPLRGMSSTAAAVAAKQSSCVASSTPCQRRRRRSRTDILQNVKKSIRKSSVGCTMATVGSA